MTWERSRDADFKEPKFKQFWSWWNCCESLGRCNQVRLVGANLCGGGHGFDPYFFERYFMVVNCVCEGATAGVANG
jgi:hypothetical protein